MIFIDESIVLFRGDLRRSCDWMVGVEDLLAEQTNTHNSALDIESGRPVVAASDAVRLLSRRSSQLRCVLLVASREEEETTDIK